MGTDEKLINGDRLELFLQEKILPDLEKGRPTDRPHTLDVVGKIKDIISHSPELELDQEVLIIAAYAHDWGYTGLFDNSQPLTMAQLGAQKDNHMLIGSQKLIKLLEDPFFEFLSPIQKQRTVYLVGIHDKLDALHDVDEKVLMEADSLAGMNTEIMGTFDEPASEQRYMQKARDLRLARFITDYGKQEFERLFEKRKASYEAKVKSSENNL